MTFYLHKKQRHTGLFASLGALVFGALVFGIVYRLKQRRNAIELPSASKIDIPIGADTPAVGGL